MTAGRISDYDPRYCEMLIEHMEKGLTFESFAAVPGVTFRTLYNWEKKHPEFFHAREIGLAKSLLWWEQSSMAAAYGKTKNRANAGLIMFHMRNKFKDLFNADAEQQESNNQTFVLAYDPKAIGGNNGEEKTITASDEGEQRVLPRSVQGGDG